MFVQLKTRTIVSPLLGSIIVNVCSPGGRPEMAIGLPSQYRDSMSIVQSIFVLYRLPEYPVRVICSDLATPSLFSIVSPLASIALNEAPRAVVASKALLPLSVVLLTSPNMLPSRDFTYGSRTILANGTITTPTAMRQTSISPSLFSLLVSIIVRRDSGARPALNFFGSISLLMVLCIGDG